MPVDNHPDIAYNPSIMNQYTATFWLCKKNRTADTVVKVTTVKITAVDILSALHQTERLFALLSPAPKGQYWKRYGAIERTA